MVVSEGLSCMLRAALAKFVDSNIRQSWPTWCKMWQAVQFSKAYENIFILRIMPFITNHFHNLKKNHLELLKKGTNTSFGCYSVTWRRCLKIDLRHLLFVFLKYSEMPSLCVPQRRTCPNLSDVAISFLSNFGFCVNAATKTTIMKHIFSLQRGQLSQRGQMCCCSCSFRRPCIGHI